LKPYGFVNFGHWISDLFLISSGSGMNLYFIFLQTVLAVFVVSTLEAPAAGG